MAAEDLDWYQRTPPEPQRKPWLPMPFFFEPILPSLDMSISISIGVTIGQNPGNNYDVSVGVGVRVLMNSGTLAAGRYRR